MADRKHRRQRLLRFNRETLAEAMKRCVTPLHIPDNAIITNVTYESNAVRLTFTSDELEDEQRLTVTLTNEQTRRAT